MLAAALLGIALALPATVVRIAPEGEPGEPLRVEGTVRHADGSPAAGVALRVFQADADGRYTPERPMDEPNARLSARLTTDGQGRYAFRTVRPGGYADAVELGGEPRRIPAHIHLDVELPHGGTLRLQMVFRDDPRLDAYWLDWAAGHGHPVVTPRRDASSLWRVEHDIVLPP